MKMVWLNSPTESTLDPPYGEIQEILVLFMIDNYIVRYQNAMINLTISDYTQNNYQLVEIKTKSNQTTKLST